MPKHPVTEAMREVGIHEIKGIDDLLSEKARRCFSDENMERKLQEADLLERAFELAERKAKGEGENPDHNHDSAGGSVRSIRESLSLSSLIEGKGDVTFDDEANLADEEEYLQQSLMKFNGFSAEELLVHDLALDD
jgi:hypothetical protein